MSYDRILQNIKKLKEDIAEAAEKNGRQPEAIKLIAVSKTQPVEYIRYAYDAGLRLFGENRVQELEEKVKGNSFRGTGIKSQKEKLLPEDIEWHLIGHLQSNKVKKAISCTSWIHSVDTLPLLQRIDRITGEEKPKSKTNVLFEINITKEESKFGFIEEPEIFRACEAALACNNINICGLMTIAPFGAKEKELHIIFAALRKLKERLEREFAVYLPELSMGMSGDFKIAIAEGATFIRVGSAIFGQRQDAPLKH